MLTCRADESIERVEMDGFAFPLGAYPIEKMEPKQGYTLHFVPADGGEHGSDGGPGERAGSGGDPIDDVERGGTADGGAGGGGGSDAWDEWPDRYEFDIVITSSRLEALCRAFISMLPGRVYPILDVLGHDAYREIDPYVAYDLVGLERFLDGVWRYRDFFLEDGMVGFGAMTEEPFIYMFVDEHKIINVRVETSYRERVERVLAAFDLAEVDRIAGADAATHEHRTVLATPDDQPNLLTSEEIVEQLRDDWGLVLNVDEAHNLDDEGNELGITGWACVVRHEEPDEKAKADGRLDWVIVRYAEVFLTADCMASACEMSLSALDGLGDPPTSAAAAAGKKAQTPELPPANPAGKPSKSAGESPKRSGGRKAGKAEEPAEEGAAPLETDEIGAVVVAADRLTPEQFREALKTVGGAPAKRPRFNEMKILYARWLS